MDQRWKRGSGWRDGPAFLDATSSVSASTFGARRLPEIKNLYFSTRFLEDDKEDSIIHERKNLLSGGGKRSSRHLRRRTTAIRSKRHRHRYPTTSDIGKTPGDGEDELNVSQPEFKGETRKSNRKKRSLLEGERFQWLLPIGGAQDADKETDSTKTSNKSWLVTHLWHSKRFHLLSLPANDPVFGGWTGIPLVHTNRGPRAALRLSQNKDESSNKVSSVMIRDVTWEEQTLLLAFTGKASNQEQSTHFLLQRLGTICPGLVQQGEGLSKFFSGSLSVEETVYEPNSFPSGAIGPATWRILPTRGAVEIRCHPSIRPRIQEILRQLAKSIPESSSHRLEIDIALKGIPRICFRLYGKESWKVLNKVLKLQQGDISEVIEKHQNHSSHGFIIQINKVEVAKVNPLSHESSHVTLIYRAPRPLDCPANCAMAGWEVHCANATFAKLLWLALVTFDDSEKTSSSNYTSDESSTAKEDPTIRGCCTIGLIEDCHMRLECEPPIPIFPRDYVDTQDSQKYWMPSSGCSWKHIRQLCEGGWGRLPVNKERRLDKLGAINFSKLVGLNDADDNRSENDGGEEEEDTPGTIVAVRGAFGQPFLDAIQASCGTYTSKSTDESDASKREIKKRRRNRRSTRPKNQTIIPPPLSKASRVSLGDYCHRLSTSLSLPAVLLVHIRAVGKGKIAPGMSILCADSNSVDILGRITAGGFSPSRGICHGIGVVGAVRLLEYLVRTTNEDSNTSTTSYGRIAQLANGSQSLQLVVRLEKTTGQGVPEEGGCEASLSALI